MPTYTPNRFSGQMAQANALRAYTPNYFARQGSGNTTGALAPHLSVAAGDRPFASDVALLSGVPGFPSAATLDSYWRYSPHTYETRIGKLLGPHQGTLEQLRNPQAGEGGLPAGYTRVVDEDGNVRIVPPADQEGSSD